MPEVHGASALCVTDDYPQREPSRCRCIVLSRSERDAQKCTKCQSYQAWFASKFGLSSTILISNHRSFFCFDRRCSGHQRIAHGKKFASDLFVSQGSDADVLSRCWRTTDRPMRSRFSSYGVSKYRRRLPQSLRSCIMKTNAMGATVPPGGAVLLELRLTTARYNNRGRVVNTCALIFVINDFKGYTLRTDAPIPFAEKSRLS